MQDETSNAQPFGENENALLLAFWLSDIQGSTALVAAHGANYVAALEHHREIARTLCEKWSGQLVEARGDSLFAVFECPDNALRCACELRNTLEHVDFGPFALKIRLGAHFGQLLPLKTGFAGLDLHVGARICEAAHGGQILVSQEMKEAAHASNFAPEQCRNLGDFSLRGLDSPRMLWEICDENATDFPALRASGAAPHNLPAPLDEFIGREAELRQLQSILRQGARILTLYGPGGSGKTRLALQLARAHHPFFADGAFLVEMAAVAASDDAFETQNRIAGAIATALGLSEVSDAEPARRLETVLESRQMLLLLDNCEHLLVGAPLLSQLACKAPDVQFVVTSREPLQLRGERRFFVGPLGLPADETVSEIERAEATRLLRNRARNADPDWEIAPKQHVFTARLCARLDGLPLALELVAPHLHSRFGGSPEAVFRSLETQGALSFRGPRDADGRHQSLYNAISWSYSRLSPKLQKAFRALGVFRGGVSPDAFFAVAQADATTLAALERAQLVRNSPDSERRIVLETLLEFAELELRKQGEVPEIAQRHAQFFADWLKGIRGEFSRENLKKIREELPNLRVALEFLEQHDTLRFLRLSARLGNFWEAVSILGEGHTRTEKALAIAQNLKASDSSIDAPTLKRLEADLHASSVALAFLRADFARLHAASEAIFANPHATPKALGTAQMWRGAMAFYTFDFESALPHLERALDILLSLPHRQRTATTIIFLGMTHLNTPPFIEENVEVAVEYYRRALDYAPLYTNARTQAFFYQGDAIALCRGDYAAGAVHFEQALHHARISGDDFYEAYALWGLSQTAREAGDLGAAHAHLKRATRLHRDAQHGWSAPFVYEAAAHLAIFERQSELGAFFLGAAHRARSLIGVPLSHSYKKNHARIEAMLDTQMSPDEKERWKARSALFAPGAIEFYELIQGTRKLADLPLTL